MTLQFNKNVTHDKMIDEEEDEDNEDEDASLTLPFDIFDEESRNNESVAPAVTRVAHDPR